MQHDTMTALERSMARQIDLLIGALIGRIQLLEEQREEDQAALLPMLAFFDILIKSQTSSPR